jgi:hypothetical protein
LHVGTARLGQTCCSRRHLDRLLARWQFERGRAATRFRAGSLSSMCWGAAFRPARTSACSARCSSRAPSVLRARHHLQSLPSRCRRTAGERCAPDARARPRHESYCAAPPSRTVRVWAAPRAAGSPAYRAPLRRAAGLARAPRCPRAGQDLPITSGHGEREHWHRAGSVVPLAPPACRTPRPANRAEMWQARPERRSRSRSEYHSNQQPAADDPMDMIGTRIISNMR